MAEAGRMGIEIPPSVIKTTRAVLLSGLKGVPLVRFCRDYKALVGEEFPWKKLGFKSLVEMLNVSLLRENLEMRGAVYIHAHSLSQTPCF